MKKPKTSNLVVASAVVSVVLYTTAAFLLQFMGGMEISPTLTTAWFGFWAVELAALAGIKITKTKNEQRNHDESQQYSESEDYSE